MNKKKNISLLIIFTLLIFAMTAVITPYSAFAQDPPSIVDPFADDTPPTLVLDIEEGEDEDDDEADDPYVPSPTPPPVTAPTPTAPDPTTPAPVYIPPTAPAAVPATTIQPTTTAAPLHSSEVVGDEVPDSGPEVYVLLMLSLILGGGYYKIKKRFV